MRNSTARLTVSFNTKKVRLKLYNPVYCDRVAGVFQYQKGAIKTKARKKSANFMLPFNTKKVRLKPDISALSVLASGFQYQKGAIKTSLAVVTDLSPAYPFNTKKVRLKPLVAI